MIDLRSDTVTRPTAAMQQAMAAAPVGDDVFGDDPTVIQLEARVAELLGKSAAVFMPSGTMCNQIGLRVHCVPGDEFICETDCHIYNYEQAAFAQLSGLAPRTIRGERGVLQVGQLVDEIRPDDAHYARTRLVCLENTHNRGGGRILPFETVAEISAWATNNGLARHLDGARLFNASVATGIPLSKWAACFDTVSVCFSKGLGAPIGSALVGDESAIQAARRDRKAWGGGMRQVGTVASAALYALDNHIDRLADDHAHARILAEGIADCRELELFSDPLETNLVVANMAEDDRLSQPLVDQLAAQDIHCLAVGKTRIRFVTHLDVTREQCETAALAIRNLQL